MEQPQEASPFETSDMLATFLASTPLLSESWRLCAAANSSAPGVFLAGSVGEVALLAFSGVQPLAGLDNSCGSLVRIDGGGCGIFSAALSKGGDGDGDGGGRPAMVHGGLLHLFLAIYNNPVFQSQIMEIMKKSKLIVFTGHSVGGAIASLAALWLLSHIHSMSPPPLVLCITFGSPMLGNESLARAMLKERWTGNFCHLVGKHDIVTRLLLAPVAPVTPHLHFLIQYWHLRMSSSPPSSFNTPCNTQFPADLPLLPDEQKSELFLYVLAHLESLASRVREGYYADTAERVCFWPFGSYMFCTNKGAVCVDNPTAVAKLLHMMFASGSPYSCIEDHLNYGGYVDNISLQCLRRNDFGHALLPDSSYEAGIALALHYSEMDAYESLSVPAKDCLKLAKRLGCTPSLNSAYLAIGLSKITPLRAQIEWYKASCDESDFQVGYYDSFKLRSASKRDFKVNMNRIRLGQFWDDLMQMLETNQLPYDFQKREKWVYASQFYKLLVEPLDIAEYYRTGMHRKKGHYIKHGREKRYEIFDRWWKDRKVGDEEKNRKRTKFASLTQDSCFWARVEEARDWLDNIRSERNARNISILCETMDKFQQYANMMVERKEISQDVLYKNSSFTLWVAEWRVLKTQFQQMRLQFPSFLDGEIVP